MQNNVINIHSSAVAEIVLIGHLATLEGLEEIEKWLTYTSKSFFIFNHKTVTFLQRQLTLLNIEEKVDLNNIYHRHSLAP